MTTEPFLLAATWVRRPTEPRDQPPAAAIRIHGVYPSVLAARTAVRAMAAEQPDLFTYVIDDVGRWLPACEPHRAASRVVGDEVEEVSCTENNDPSQGRAGSVCDVRRHSGPSLDRAAAPVGGDTTTPDTHHPDPGRQRETKRQQRQLDDLLRGPLPCPTKPIHDHTSYANLRGQLATLRAFERKLARLATEAADRCAAHREHLLDLDARHPDFRAQYLDNYTRALAEVGLRPENVPLMRYLKDDEESHGAAIS
jgi:hypothetical protein